MHHAADGTRDVTLWAYGLLGGVAMTMPLTFSISMKCFFQGLQLPRAMNDFQGCLMGTPSANLLDFRGGGGNT